MALTQRCCLTISNTQSPPEGSVQGKHSVKLLGDKHGPLQGASQGKPGNQHEKRVTPGVIGMLMSWGCWCRGDAGPMGMPGVTQTPLLVSAETG